MFLSWLREAFVANYTLCWSKTFIHLVSREIIIATHPSLEIPGTILNEASYVNVVVSYSTIGVFLCCYVEHEN